MPRSGELLPVKVFAHYLGDDRGAMRERFARVHDDVLYELPLLVEGTCPTRRAGSRAVEQQDGRAALLLV